MRGQVSDYRRAPKLTRNAIRCLSCGDTIESKSVHDCRYCKCGACFVDGGLEYTRRGYSGLGFEELAEYETNLQPLKEET